jgi:hypothetical protein
MYRDEIAIIMLKISGVTLKIIGGWVTRHMEFCNPELKYSDFLFSPQMLISKMKLAKPLVCILAKLRTGLRGIMVRFVIIARIISLT